MAVTGRYVQHTRRAGIEVETSEGRRMFPLAHEFRVVEGTKTDNRQVPTAALKPGARVSLCGVPGGGEVHTVRIL